MAPIDATHGRLLPVVAAMVMLAGCSRSTPAPPPAPAAQPQAAPTQAAAAAEPWFEECATQRGIGFVHQSGATGQFLFPEIMCGGGALFDMDGDGDLDAYLVQSGSLVDPPASRPGNRLYRNRGDGTFEDVTAGSGAEGRGYGMGVACGDYDNDGDVDLYITNVGPNVLLRNDGHGHFTDVTATAGVGDDGWGTSAAFVDVDADGDLDLFVVNYVIWSMESEVHCYRVAGGRDYCSPNAYNAPSPSVLYINNGDGTFSDKSVEAGLRGAFGNGLGIVCADFDGDGRVDVFVANDTMKNQLWMNQGGGVFRDEAIIRGCAMDQNGQAKAGMGVAATDLDDDGDFDLLVVNLINETDSIYINEGAFFVDGTATRGLGTVSRPFTRFGAGLLDLDNDGSLDLYIATGRVGLEGTSSLVSEDPFAEPDLLFRGSPQGRFEEVHPRGGADRPLIATSRAAAFGDIDNDGGIDILVVNRDGPAHLLHNIVRNRGHWIMFRVVEEHGRDALGATLTCSVGTRTLTRCVQAAYSYESSNDPRVHLGLGPATSVDGVKVRWPDGTVQEFGRFDADRIVELRRKPVAAR